MLEKICLSLILFYQNKISSEKGALYAIFGIKNVCRFSPTCSEYLYKAIKRYGIIKGLFLGTGRILRCHPFNKGGFDPVP